MIAGTGGPGKVICDAAESDINPFLLTSAHVLFLVLLVLLHIKHQGSSCETNILQQTQKPSQNEIQARQNVNFNSVEVAVMSIFK